MTHSSTDATRVIAYIIHMMKLFATLAAAIIGINASNLGDWCEENALDVVQCKAMQDADSWSCGNNDEACYQLNLDVISQENGKINHRQKRGLFPSFRERISQTVL